MRDLEVRRRKSIYAAVAVIAAALALGIFLTQKFVHSIDRPVHVARGSNSHVGLARKLADLDARLDKGLSSEEMLEFASGIQEEIQTHPLPEDDDLQFSGELVVKYLRELGNIENYRRATISKKGYDPLDPSGGHSNAEMIELQKKYWMWLRQRTREFKERLSQLG